MTTPDDNLLAGVSRRAPRMTYSVALPDDTLVTLLRPRGGRLSSVTLQVSPATVARLCESGAPSVATTSLFLRDARPPEPWQSARVEGLRALLLDRALLSHPEWIRGDCVPTDCTDDERALLASICASLRAQLELADLTATECEACRGHRAMALRDDLAPFERALKGVECHAREIDAWLQRARDLRRVLGSEDDRRRCAHVALASEGLTAIVDAHEELVFELAGVLDSASDNTRFVLSASFGAATLQSWLSVGGHSTATRSTGLQPVTPRSRVEVSPREPAALSAAQRKMVGYAASAWEINAPLEVLGERAEDGADGSSMRYIEEDPRWEVASRVPSFAVKRPPETPGQIARAPTKGSETRSAVRATPATRFVTHEMLRAAGISDALIREMVREGRFVEVAKGRYTTPQKQKKSRR